MYHLIRPVYCCSESESEEYVEETNTGFYSTAVECALVTFENLCPE